MPVMTIAAIFVDVSRRKLAEGVVYTAADLTMNTLLTQYDAELSEYYGMMASAQNVSDMIGKTHVFVIEDSDLDESADNELVPQYTHTSRIYVYVDEDDEPIEEGQEQYVRNDNRVYDLLGRPQSQDAPLKPGIYIRNGRKVMVR